MQLANMVIQPTVLSTDGTIITRVHVDAIALQRVPTATRVHHQHPTTQTVYSG